MCPCNRGFSKSPPGCLLEAEHRAPEGLPTSSKHLGGDLLRTPIAKDIPNSDRICLRTFSLDFVYNQRDFQWSRRALFLEQVDYQYLVKTYGAFCRYQSQRYFMWWLLSERYFFRAVWKGFWPIKLFTDALNTQNISFLPTSYILICVYTLIYT